MKILVVAEHFPSLSETFVLNQVTGLLDLGHDVTIYPVGKPSGPVTHPDVKKYGLMDRTWAGAGVPVSKRRRLQTALRQMPAFLRGAFLARFHTFNPARHGRAALNLSLFYSCLPLLERETRFDAVHCHFGGKGLRALTWREMGLIQGPISTVFHAHELAGLSDKEGRKRYAPLFKSGTLLLPISHHWRQRLIRWGADPRRTLVHHMGVDSAEFEYFPHIRDRKAPVRILTVGRLVEQKGYEFALRAVARLRAMIREKIDYRIVGSGELEPLLKRLVTELDLEDVVRFAGAQPLDQVDRALQESHLFILPSVTAANGFQEGIPVALMEAMASGVPVVTTRHSGIPELVDHGVSGFLAEERAVEPLAESMARLISEPGLVARITEQARKKIEQEFNIRTLNLQLQERFRNESERDRTKHPARGSYQTSHAH